MAAVATYAFKDVLVLLNGVPVYGFADGDDVIQVERSREAFSLLVGADGDAMALKAADRSGVATLKLMQSSAANAAISALLKLQDAGILSPVPFAVKDTNGLDLILAEAAFPAGPPRMLYGVGANAREWKLLLPSVDIFAGGFV